jgi:hypothetical protein
VRLPGTREHQRWAGDAWFLIRSVEARWERLADSDRAYDYPVYIC